jgi:molybdopterin-guanine dinucleotide biosynthesis protein A
VEPYEGEALLGRAVLRVAAACAEVLVVLAPDADPPRMGIDVPVRFARDAAPGLGPLAGIVAGLRVATAPIALVAAGDMPELHPPVLRLLLAEAADRSADAIALRDGERLGPMPCALRVDPAVRAAELLLRQGRRSVRELLDVLGAEAVEESAWRALDPQGRTLVDVDVPDDLR